MRTQTFSTLGRFVLLIAFVYVTGCAKTGSNHVPPNPPVSTPTEDPFVSVLNPQVDTVLFAKTTTIKWSTNGTVTISGLFLQTQEGNTIVVGPFTASGKHDYTISATLNGKTVSKTISVFVPSERISFFCGTAWRNTEWKVVEPDGYVQINTPLCNTIRYFPNWKCDVRVECSESIPVGTVHSGIPWKLEDNEQTFVSNPPATNRWQIVSVTATRYVLKQTVGDGATYYLTYSAVPW